MGLLDSASRIESEAEARELAESLVNTVLRLKRRAIDEGQMPNDAVEKLRQLYRLQVAPEYYVALEIVLENGPLNATAQKVSAAEMAQGQVQWDAAKLKETTKKHWPIGRIVIGLIVIGLVIRTLKGLWPLMGMPILAVIPIARIGDVGEAALQVPAGANLAFTSHLRNGKWSQTTYVQFDVSVSSGGKEVGKMSCDGYHFGGGRASRGSVDSNTQFNDDCVLLIAPPGVDHVRVATKWKEPIELPTFEGFEVRIGRDD